MQDTRLKTQDARRKTQDSRRKTQDSRLKTHNFGLWSVVFGLWSLVCGLFLTGCAEQQQYVAVKPICAENIDKPQAMEIAEDVLAKMHFTIEKADSESGFIRTRPLQGAQFFEFWRTDNVGANNWLQSNLHSIRRIVELNISEQDENLNISCDAQIYRLSLPERHVSSSARAYAMFSQSSPALQRLKLNPKQKAAMAWINVGEDRQLAAEILKRISSMLDIENRESNDE